MAKLVRSSASLVSYPWALSSLARQLTRLPIVCSFDPISPSLGQLVPTIPPYICLDSIGCAILVPNPLLNYVYRWCILQWLSVVMGTRGGAGVTLLRHL